MTDETQNDQTTVMAAPPDPYAETTIHEYAAVRAPNLSTRVTVGSTDYTIKFQKGVARVPGHVARELDRCIREEIGGVSQLVRKLDRAAAIQLAMEHANSMRPSAARGGFNSGHIEQLKNEARAASGKSLGEVAPNNPEALAEFTKELANGDLLVTELRNSEVKTDVTAAPASQPKPFSALRLRQ